MQFYRLQSLCICMKICIVVKDFVMTLLVPTDYIEDQFILVLLKEHSASLINII